MKLLLTLKPKPAFRKNGTVAKFFCGRCGCEVPYERKYFVEFFQKEIHGANQWILNFGYICPDCANVTHWSATFSCPQEKLLRKFNLYNNGKDKQEINMQGTHSLDNEIKS